MQDLSKIDFGKCKLPEWCGCALEACYVPELNAASVSIRGDARIAKRRVDGEWLQFVSGTFDELRALEAICRQVDTFIESELTKRAEPEWRPCTVEFAFTHPTESEWQCGGHGGGWEPMTKPPGGYCAKYAHYYEFRTKTPLQQQSDPIDTRNPGRTYSSRDERKVTAKFGTSLGFAGGRENTPRAEIVRSNYYGANQNEANVKITGQCSVETLRAILAWAESQLELVPDEDRCYPAPGWWRVK